MATESYHTRARPRFKLVMFSCARQWLETARAKSTRGDELVPAERSRALGLYEASCKESKAPLRVENPPQARWVGPPKSIQPHRRLLGSGFESPAPRAPDRNPRHTI